MSGVQGKREKDTAAIIEKMIEPLLSRLGFELVLLQYQRDRGGHVLRLFIDKLGIDTPSAEAPSAEAPSAEAPSAAAPSAAAPSAAAPSAEAPSAEAQALGKPGGVQLEDCAEVSREVSALLEVEDPIRDAYHLEVSSPGLDRPLAKQRDFARFSGQKAKVVTHEPINGRRTFHGVLGGLENGEVLITVDGQLHRIPHAAIARANIEYQF